MRGISCLVEDLSASQEGFCYMEFVRTIRPVVGFVIAGDVAEHEVLYCKMNSGLTAYRNKKKVII
jgi:hypothetical protein